MLRESRDHIRGKCTRRARYVNKFAEKAALGVCSLRVPSSGQSASSSELEIVFLLWLVDASGKFAFWLATPVQRPCMTLGRSLIRTNMQSYFITQGQPPTLYRKHPKAKDIIFAQPLTFSSHNCVGLVFFLFAAFRIATFFLVCLCVFRVNASVFCYVCEGIPAGSLLCARRRASVTLESYPLDNDRWKFAFPTRQWDSQRRVKRFHRRLTTTLCYLQCVYRESIFGENVRFMEFVFFVSAKDDDATLSTRATSLRCVVWYLVFA